MPISFQRFILDAGASHSPRHLHPKPATPHLWRYFLNLMEKLIGSRYSPSLFSM